jgi:hypothetical protein
MSIAKALGEYLDAAFAGVWVQTQEPEDCSAEIRSLCDGRSWNYAYWDIARGLVGKQSDPEMKDPLALLAALDAFKPVGEGNASVIVLGSFHRFMESAEIVQQLAFCVDKGKRNRVFLVIMAPVVQLPPELEKAFVVLEHDMPTREQLADIARLVATQEGELPEGTELERVLDAACGLTRMEAEGAFALSLVRHGSVKPDVLWELKAGMLKKSGLLTLYRGGDRFSNLGGLEALKVFCSRAMRPGAKQKPRGIMLLGVPGAGKSAFSKALGNETGRPALTLDIGALMGSLVGQTAARRMPCWWRKPDLTPPATWCGGRRASSAGAASALRTRSKATVPTRCWRTGGGSFAGRAWGTDSCGSTECWPNSCCAVPESESESHHMRRLRDELAWEYEEALAAEGDTLRPAEKSKHGEGNGGKKLQNAGTETGILPGSPGGCFVERRSSCRAGRLSANGWIDKTTLQSSALAQQSACRIARAPACGPSHRVLGSAEE